MVAVKLCCSIHPFPVWPFGMRGMAFDIPIVDGKAGEGALVVNAARAFTLIELLVVVAVISVLIAMMLPSLSAAREMTRRSGCAANLHYIGKAMSTYATAEGSFPTNVPPKTTSGVGVWKNPPKAAGISDGLDPLYNLFNAVPKYGDPMTNLWVLVLNNLATPGQFICKSDPRAPVPAERHYDASFSPPGGTYTDFGTINDVLGGGDTFSYSFPYPWSSTSSTVPLWWKGDPNSAAPIGADMGPTKSSAADDPTAMVGSAASNSKNHAGKGQNVLFADAHVEFSKRNDVGRGGDNIYTGDGDNLYVVTGGAKFNTITNLNANPSDVVLVPGRP